LLLGPRPLLGLRRGTLLLQRGQVPPPAPEQRRVPVAVAGVVRRGLGRRRGRLGSGRGRRRAALQGGQRLLVAVGRQLTRVQRQVQREGGAASRLALPVALTAEQLRDLPG